MPYRRLKEAPKQEKLVRSFENAIRSLVQRFRDHPYAFYTESDMHCYLYHRLYSGGLFNSIFKTSDGHDTILLHKEYPTVARYKRTNGIIKESAQGNRRGAFDISIWDPQFIRERKHRTQKVICAAELALNECSTGSMHTINDKIKLTGPTNEIKYGYLLFFVRDNREYYRNEKVIRHNLEDAAKRIRVVIAIVDKENKPKPEFLGKWKEV
jgi:hypothetical protein